MIPILLAAGLIVLTSVASADTTTATPRYHYEPWPLDPGSSILTVGVSLSILPEPVVESEVPAPALEAQLRHGIAPRLSLVATASTNVLTSVGQLGVQWNDHSGPLSYALGNNLIGFYGWLSIEGQFEQNWAVALGTVPLVRIGYRLDDFSVSAAFAAVFVLASESHVGPLRAPGPSTPLNDMFLTFAIEQPFLRSASLSMGLSLTYSRTPYQSWILFNTVDQFLLIPELFFGFQLYRSQSVCSRRRRWRPSSVPRSRTASRHR